MDITQILFKIFNLCMKNGVEVYIENQGKNNLILLDIHNKKLSLNIKTPEDEKVLSDLKKILKELDDFFN